ncbi:MAG: L-tyrosine/L-tryptophan isonitrile synthase family protein [Methyloceanibacter sp.]
MSTFQAQPIRFASTAIAQIFPCANQEKAAAERVFSVLISGAYRRNSLARMRLAECRPAMISALRRCTKNGSPIQLTVLAFPFKTPNSAKVGARRLPDFAEFAAIRHCCALRDAIQVVYPPGLEFHILHDGLLIAEVVGIEAQEVRQYEEYFAKLTKIAGASDFIRCHDFGALQQRRALDPSSSIEQLRSEAEQWWQLNRGTADWDHRFRKTLGMINLREFPTTLIVNLLRHSRLGGLPPGFEPLERRVHEAMVQYHVKDAIIHQFDPRPHCFPDAIHATTQDRRGRLSIWLLRRGQSLLPWHGVGCLDERGRAQIVHSVQVLDRSDHRPVFIAGEETPFVYRKSNSVSTWASPLSNGGQ